VTTSFARAAIGVSAHIDGKFLAIDGERFLVKGVAYGTFAPTAEGSHFPESARMAADFDAIAAAGFNTVRTYTTPSPATLDEAGRHGLRVMVGLPWPQHIAFLGDVQLARRIRRDAVAAVRRLMSHPAVLMFAVGNEIPPAVVRWHGHRLIERFLSAMYDDIKSAAPESVLTYVNFPPTEYLDLRCFDVCAFNVYLHRERELRAYLARLQHIAGPKPLLLAEAGADSRREGLGGQAAITAMHVRTAFAEGACGAVVYSWTDEWWRGGQMVQDWAFGLVDGDRQTKPALPVVSAAFADAPFAADDRARWPSVSVVVCAYDAADTIDDCVTSLTALTYPDLEIIVVNDGSRDATGAIARRHEGVRVIDTANGGLSAARNVGLAAARGEIVAYTDADVRVDRDWLRYLIQPLLREDVVGAGGPNVVPHDDPWLAQCVARAPGGPRHVLLDDRLAEHVPGCNMAFRRDALLAMGGFNPVFVCAGDDVDVCWRLQARGLRIGFAPAALVWHHHRRTIEAFWRQQVGYGEAEAVLRAHHPERFSGGRILWRGRIYSPLPFPANVRQRRINTGVWGTAAFPSVYAGESHWSSLPHSPVWVVVASTLLVLGGLFPADPSRGAAWVLLAGLAGWLTTLARCVVLALRCDLRELPDLGLPPVVRRVVYTATIAWLHVLQPLARMRGRLRGAWSLPTVAGEASGVSGAGGGNGADEAGKGLIDLTHPTRLTRPTVRLLLGLIEERAFWSESWLAHSTVLSELARMLRASRPAPIVEVDDGWHLDRDVSLAIDRWGWLDVRVLVEEHAGGRCLLRVGVRLRLRLAGALQIIALAALAATGIAASTADRHAVAALLLAASAAAIARGAWQASRAMTIVTRALERVTAGADLIPLPDRRAESGRDGGRWRFVSAPRAVQAVLLIVLVAYATVGRQSDANDATATGEASLRESAALDVARTAGGVAVGIAGDLFVADAQRHVIRRLRPRPPAGASWSAADIASGGDPLLGAAIPFDGAADIARASNGDLYVADPGRHRVMRVVPSTGHIITIAGSGSAGFSGDGGAAHDASLDGPSALAAAPNGDLYVADTLNNRVRVIAHATGLITAVAGDGRAGNGEAVGDGGPALSAHLSRPMGLAIAPDGDLYIADTGHHRVRRIDAATGHITTVAGDGVAGSHGDGGPAVRARLADPIGLALASNGNGLFVYIADWRNNRVRAIDPTGSIATVNESVPVEAPTRIAYHSAGWLYVKDASRDGVTALATIARRAVAGARKAGSRTGGE
jgi:GT2 family glycosyltransferase/sugar lactone lactonase YvrE